MLFRSIPWISRSTLFLLMIVLFFSCLWIVYDKHQSRQLFILLQQYQEQIESLQLEWSQLLLEQSTWSSDARVERMARERLRMTLPEPNEVVVMAPLSQSRVADGS